MGQLLSSEEELSEVKEAIGCCLYDAMLEGGAAPDLAVVHPLLLTGQDESLDSRARLQGQLRKLQGDMGNRAPAYLKDLISRLVAFSDEPRLASLVGLVVTMVMDMAYTSKRSSGVTGKSAGSSSGQRVQELQEVMEEYLKRCRINLADHRRLTQDTVRLEAQFSLILTQLKSCLLRGDCDSRSLRQWASGAAFHTQMLVHLARLEGQAEPLAARAALEQYQEDLTQIIPAYRQYKSHTVSVVKCRGDLHGLPSELGEEGAMTGITVMDKETGKSVTIPLSALERETGRKRRVSGPDNTSAPVYSSASLDLITSDQYAQAYLDHLFSDKGPVADLENYFTKASDKLSVLRTDPGSKNGTGASNGTELIDGVHLKCQAEGMSRKETMDCENDGRGERRRLREEEEMAGCEQRDESLKLSIVETEPTEGLNHRPPHPTTT
ncbi:uncharacterized protein LOC115372990 isoform X2 [Myripristis murdjan]|uniref:uncharacterized protein LOC115372990 isoform X2 n=1 Tax=Myripristis murdjan TaxID=586833 RepID=UPI001175D159|nr:uncharacterized protein LOC115372990 isoform X2 [Myripristis murdjan]